MATTAEDQATAVYIYGIVPGDVELTEDARGLGEREVRLVRHGDIAALVSDIEVRDAIGRPEDLTAHEELLDATALEAPVLPFRFGAVMTDQDAVAEELLAPNHDAFASALEELEGRTEYVVKVRFSEQRLLKEVVSENSEAAELRDTIRDTDEAGTRDARIRLGEIIQQEIEERRGQEVRALVEELGDLAVAHAELAPTHEYEAANVAFLVESSAQDDFTDAVEDIAADHGDRLSFRLLGPLAPYDFVVAKGTEEGDGSS
jgi:hypothetical protein